MNPFVCTFSKKKRSRNARANTWLICALNSGTSGHNAKLLCKPSSQFNRLSSVSSGRHAARAHHLPGARQGDLRPGPTLRTSGIRALQRFPAATPSHTTRNGCLLLRLRTVSTGRTPVLQVATFFYLIFIIFDFLLFLFLFSSFLFVLLYNFFICNKIGWWFNSNILSFTLNYLSSIASSFAICSSALGLWYVNLPSGLPSCSSIFSLLFRTLLSYSHIEVSSS